MGLGLGIITSTPAYAFWVEPYRLSIEHVVLKLPRLPRELSGLTIAQLSDIHQSNYIREAHIRMAAEITNQLKPDAIVITGDYVYGLAERAEECARGLAKLSAPLGIFATLGNHDHWESAEVVTRSLQSHTPIQMLNNDAVPIERNGKRMWIVGVDDVWERQANLDKALRLVPKDAVKILLAHEPDFADEAARYPIDLQLSGHSHGGQIRIPFWGEMLTPPLGQKYPMGLYRIGALQLYTNRGIGMVSPAMRFNCPPEVTLFTLHNEL
jgi:hypothetical protein